MSSNIEIIKKCKWCGKEFVARKTTTEYCSHRCSGLAYKERKRQAQLREFKAKYSTQIEGKIEIEKLEFLSPTQVCRLLGVSRATAYRYFAETLSQPCSSKEKRWYDGRTLTNCSRKVISISNEKSRYGSPSLSSTHRRRCRKNSECQTPGCIRLRNVRAGRRLRAEERLFGAEAMLTATLPISSRRRKSTSGTPRLIFKPLME